MRKQKWAFPFLSVLSGASLLISSCTQTPPALPANQTAQPAADQATRLAGRAAGSAATQAVRTPADSAAQPAAGQPRQGGTVTEAVFADVKNLNPIFNSDYGSGRIIDRVFEGLVEVDPKTGEVIPWLAESWDISPDGLKYTFKLRQGVTWSDGRPFTAHDVKFTWESILDPQTETVHKSTFDRIVGAKDRIDGKATETTGIKVVDDYTLEVALAAPSCPFLLHAGIIEIAPKHILEGQDLNTAQFNVQPTVGTGPWTFGEWVRGSHVTVRANETYWGGPDGAAKGGPHIDRFAYKVVPDQTAILNNVRTGEADFGEIQPKDAEQVQQIPHVELKKWLSPRYTFIGFNLRRPVLQDKAVRKALAMGLDSRTMIDKILFGEGDPLASHMLPSSWAYNPEVPLVQFDPDGARRMLDEAGYRPGPDGIRAKGDQKLKFTLYTNSGNKTREAVATIAQQQWNEIGVDLEIQFEDFTVLLDRMRKTLDFDMIIIGWTLSPEPDPEAIFHSKAIPTSEKPGNNFVGYANPEVDRLIEQGKSVPGCSKDERQEIYFELQEILAEDQPYIWLFLNRSLYAFNKRIQGVDPSPFRQASEASWNIARWWLTP